MFGALFEDQLYNDDRMFVLHIARCRATVDDDGIATTTIYHGAPPPDCKWCLVTYRNTERYPAVRVDNFESLEEAQAYLQRVEPTVPLVSLGGSGPKTPLSYEEFVAWKKRNRMKDYDYKAMYLPGGTLSARKTPLVSKSST